MHARSNQSFSCFWQPSVRLSVIVICVYGLAIAGLLLAHIPGLWKLSLALLLGLQMGYQYYLLRCSKTPAWRFGLRHSAQGWQLWTAQNGWRAVQLRADSIAVPALVLLRYRYAHQWLYRSALIPADCLPQDSHRRLRVRLKFSRRRWQAIK